MRLCIISLLSFLIAAETKCSQEEEQEAAAPDVAQVLVIGAGPSGIAAATKLSKHGITVKVLEAEQRLGGRINSVQFGDAIVDLGAEWCHGEVGNVVYELMNGTGVISHPNYIYQWYTSDGRRVDGETLQKFDTIYDELYGNNGTVNATEEDTVGAYFMREYNRTVEHTLREERDVAFAAMAVQVMRNYILSTEGAFDWNDPSAISDYVDAAGYRTLTWDGRGYATFLTKLMENFDQRNILLNRQVESIDMDPNCDMVNVTLTNGDVLTTEYVIFTPSVGVLKNKHKQLFKPPLNEEKVACIESIGIAAVMKVMLHFPVRWWPPNSNLTSIFFAWKQEDEDTLLESFPRGPRKNRKSWIMNIMGVIGLKKNPNALSCWIVGDMVPEIERIDDETLIDGITFVLNKFLSKHYNGEQPDRILRSRWYSNAHFSGTYSFQTLKSRKIKPSANALLGEPICNNSGIPKILFAGEATHPHSFSTVHGATETGWREADRLITLLKPT